jgi:hypothetical protein
VKPSLQQFWKLNMMKSDMSIKLMRAKFTLCIQKLKQHQKLSHNKQQHRDARAASLTPSGAIGDTTGFQVSADFLPILALNFNVKRVFATFRHTTQGILLCLANATGQMRHQGLAEFVAL